MLVNEQRIAYILTKHTTFQVAIQVTELRDDIYTLALRALRRFIDPKVFLFSLFFTVLFRALLVLFDFILDLIEPLLERQQLIREQVSLRHELEEASSEFGLERHHVLGVPIFSRQFY